MYKEKQGRRKNHVYGVGGFPGGSVVKNLPAGAGDAGSIPGLGRPPGGGMATHSSVLAWRIPWTEKPGGLQSMGFSESDTTEVTLHTLIYYFPGDSVVKNPPANTRDVRDMGSIPGLGRSLGKGNGNSLQCSCLGNPMDREAWRATVHGVTSSWTQLMDNTISVKS